MVEKSDAETDDYAYDDDFEENASVSSSLNLQGNEVECSEGLEQDQHLQSTEISSVPGLSHFSKTQSISKRRKRRTFVALPASTSVSPQPMASRVIDAKMWEYRRAQDAERIANIKSTLIDTLSPPKPTPVGWR